MKKWPYTIVKGVACLGEDNVVIFYYLIASEIWPNKKGWEGSNKRGTTVTLDLLNYLLICYF